MKKFLFASAFVFMATLSAPAHAGLIDFEATGQSAPACAISTTSTPAMATPSRLCITTFARAAAASSPMARAPWS